MSSNSSSIYGSRLITTHQGTGTVYGVYSDANKSISQSGNIYSFYAIADHDGTGASYMYYGNSFGSTSGVEYGLYLIGEDENYVQGMLGVGTLPANKLDVEGGAAIGSTYAGSSIAPTNGLIVEGNAGFGSIGSTSNKVWISIPNTNTTTPTGIRNENSYNGASTKYGIYNLVSSHGTGSRTGTYNWVSSAADISYGTYNVMTPSTSTTYGTYNSVGSGTSGLRYGEYSTVSGASGSTSGIYGNYIITNHVGTGPNYGLWVDVNKSAAVSGSVFGGYFITDHDGTGNSYVLFGNSVGSTSGTEYGLYMTGEDQNYMSGNLQVNGEVTRSSTGTADMVPICYGTIDISGAILAGSGNFSVLRPATGDYRITITGESYFYANYITTATKVGSGYCSVSSVSNDLIVRVWTTAGAATNSRFSFVVYQP